jgi:hypothetical protein
VVSAYAHQGGESMFIIEEIFIDDKKLADVLRALTGLVIEMKPPRPVINAVVKKGKIKQATPETSLKEKFFAEIKKFPINTVMTSDEVKEVVTKVGGQPSGYTYYANLLTESGYATRRGRGQFVVNHKGA